ncbi:MAG: hypothetical protein GXO78_01720 [Calditrichaeota bacterium]|nr:hypothetical protein [Calditrichota bacterium]
MQYRMANGKWMVLLGILVGFITGLAQDHPHQVLKRDCGSCHTPQGWKTIVFDHQQTAFPLSGRHTQVACVDCHRVTNFSQVNRECSRCHLDVHQGGLGQDCERCHSAVGWQIFDAMEVHQNTNFPLLGAHEKLDCKSCHRREVLSEYRLLSSECQDCHLTDFRQAVNPVHTELGFGLNCENCHVLFSWRPASFREHDAYFPIFSGSHAGEWSQCATCHIQEGDYKVFSCLTCHEHSQSRTDSEHDEVSGYVYDSQACYACHPTGEGED